MYYCAKIVLIFFNLSSLYWWVGAIEYMRALVKLVIGHTTLVTLSSQWKNKVTFSCPQERVGVAKAQNRATLCKGKVRVQRIAMACVQWQ